MPWTTSWQVNQRIQVKFVYTRVQYLEGIKHNGLFQVTAFTDFFG